MGEPIIEVQAIKEEEKPVVKTPTFKNKLFKKNFLIIFGIILVLFVFGGFVLVNNFQITIGLKPAKPVSKSILITPEVYNPQTQEEISAMPSPSLNCPAGQLRLLKDGDGCVQYYNSGTVPEGKYKGYKRIVINLGGQNGSFKMIATNDDKTYVLDGDQQSLTYSIVDYRNPYNTFDKAKIVAVDDLSSNYPAVININDQFALFKVGIYTTFVGSGSEGAFLPVTDYSNYISLSSKYPNLKFYVKKYEVNSDDKDQAVKKLYFNNITEIIAVDSQGLGYSYTLTTPQNITDYNTAKAKQTNDYVASPNLDFVQSNANANRPIYKSYGVAFPGACGANIYTYEFKNLQDSQMTKIGTLKNGIDLFTPSDNSVQLLALSYNYKVAVTTDDIWGSVNKVPKPTYDQYVAQNPLIFFKDPWGNWAADGEFDYHLMGGCGKPVIYLYPKKPTQVSIKFTSAIKFDVDIPTYSNGWKVLANPDGTLTDLNPKATDCSKIDFTRIGSEYAKTPCATGKYPYLYWAGRSLEREYPNLNEGWIVAKADLSTFLNKKLDEIGLNKTEKGDMLEYWLPQLQKKNSPYYRISFLKNAEMNYLVPMVVTPAPNSVLRVFLDYQTLDSKPTTTLKPQILTKFNRSGFTMVEWGGLEK